MELKETYSYYRTHAHTQSTRTRLLAHNTPEHALTHLHICLGRQTGTEARTRCTHTHTHTLYTHTLYAHTVHTYTVNTHTSACKQSIPYHMAISIGGITFTVPMYPIDKLSGRGVENVATPINGNFAVSNPKVRNGDAQERISPGKVFGVWKSIQTSGLVVASGCDGMTW